MFIKDDLENMQKLQEIENISCDNAKNHLARDLIMLTNHMLMLVDSFIGKNQESTN